MSAQHTPQLDYAPQPPLSRHRKHVRLIALVIFVGVLGVGIRLWLPSTMQRMEELYAQHQCMAYMAPPSETAYEEAPAEAAGHGGPEHWEASGSDGILEWSGSVPQPWRHFTSSASPQGKSKISAVVFMHGRKSKSGNERLVMVEVWDSSWSAQVIRPGWMLKRPSLLSAMPFPLAPLRNRDERLKVFAGQSDLFDESHFTIGYAVDDEAGIIDGWLQDNDTVKLTVRNTPASRK
jgi:hypothetical protein